jgi:predicted enzyme related to lactoylglutathione lyase
MTTASPILVSTIAPAPLNYPSDFEFVSTDYKATTDYFKQTFGWNLKERAQNKMSFGNFGLRMSLMIASEMPYDKGLEQRARFYFTVPDVLIEIDRLVKLGATVWKEPEIIPEIGSWCFMKIPGNIIIGLWAYLPDKLPPPNPITKRPTDESVMTFFELVTPEAMFVAEFFKNAFGWTFTESVLRGGLYLYTSDKPTNSFQLGIRHSRRGERSDLTAFVTVKNLVPFTETVVRFGGEKVGEFDDYTPRGFCQKIKIPGGIVLGLWQPPLPSAESTAPLKATQASQQEIFGTGKPEVYSSQVPTS